MTATTLKQRIHDGQTIHVAAGSVTMSAEELRAKLETDAYDMVFVDLQHSPVDETALAAFCRAAAELNVPALVRIRHPREAHLIGHYLDLGPLGVVVPQVEDEATVDQAAEAFYYPPLGKRSWGPARAYRWDDFKDMPYADWWNSNGILMLQIESVPGVRNVRKLVKPGVDVLAFGENDLTLSFRSHPDSPWSSFEECRRYVVEQTEGLDVKIGESNMPLGRL